MLVPVHCLEDQRDGFTARKTDLKARINPSGFFRSITLFM
jgi:hypothetical protein